MLYTYFKVWVISEIKCEFFKENYSWLRMQISKNNHDSPTTELKMSAPNLSLHYFKIERKEKLSVKLDLCWPSFICELSRFWKCKFWYKNDGVIPIIYLLRDKILSRNLLKLWCSDSRDSSRSKMRITVGQCS